MPRIPNVGYLVAERLFHPGDAFTSPDVDTARYSPSDGSTVLKVAEAVDYLRRVRPRLAVPIHEAHLAMPQLHYGLFDRLAPEGTKVRVIDGEAGMEI